MVAIVGGGDRVRQERENDDNGEHQAEHNALHPKDHGGRHGKLLSQIPVRFLGLSRATASIRCRFSGASPAYTIVITFGGAAQWLTLGTAYTPIAGR